MAIYKIGTVLSTGLLATTLVMGGCSGKNGINGTPGTPGTNGTNGAPAVVSPLFQTAALKVSCRFDVLDADAAARDATGFFVTVEALDGQFNVIPGVLKGQAWVGSDGTVSVDAPKAFDKVTCLDTATGDTTWTYTNLTTDAPGTDALVVDGLSNALWSELSNLTARGGYKANKDWGSADMRAIEAAAHANTDLADSWEAGTINDATRPAQFRVFLNDSKTILQPFAKAMVCQASVAPAATFDVDGAVADLDNVGGDADYTVANSAYECVLGEFAGAAGTVAYSINGVTNAQVDGANNNVLADITCNGFASENGRLAGVVGRSETANDALADASLEWYAVRLHYGLDSDDASHAAADAVYYGAALMCEDTSTSDCTLDTGSNITFTSDFGAQPPFFCDDESDFATIGDCTVGANTTAFAYSTTARASIDGTSELWVVKNCSPTGDTELSFDGTTGVTALTVTNDITVAAEAVQASGHIGFVVAQIDQARPDQYKALVRLARQNTTGDSVSAFTNSLLNAYDAAGDFEANPRDLAIALASGNALCDADLTQLSGVDYLVGAKTVTKPNIAVAGLPVGEEADISCAGDNDATRVVDENGVLSFRCVAAAGDTITVDANGVTQTCTVQ